MANYATHSTELNESDSLKACIYTNAEDSVKQSHLNPHHFARGWEFLTVEHEVPSLSLGEASLLCLSHTSPGCINVSGETDVVRE